MKLSPQRMMAVHAFAGISFIGLWLTATIVGWVSSPIFISHVSMIALVYAAFAGWQAAMAADEAHDEEGD